MPRPTKEHERLAAFAGSWRGEEQIHPSPWDPKGGPAASHVEARMDMDGFFLVTDYRQERGGKVCYRGHGVYGYDPGRQVWTSHWFDSMGCVPAKPSDGRWEGNTLAFQHGGEFGHSRYVYELESDGRYRFRIDCSEDGRSWSTFMEGRYTRV